MNKILLLLLFVPIFGIAQQKSPIELETSDTTFCHKVLINVDENCCVIPEPIETIVCETFECTRLYYYEMTGEGCLPRKVYINKKEHFEQIAKEKF